MISVVIPTLNEEANITECLHSIRAQNLPCEIIVVDGGSTDKTVELAKVYADKVYVLEKQGIGLARDYGTRLSSGNIIVSADGDCLYPSGWLERLTKPFEDPYIVVVGGSFKPKDSSPLANMFAGSLTFAASTKNLFVGSNMAFRKDAFFKVGGYRKFLRGEDWDLSLRLARVGKAFYEPSAICLVDVPVNRKIEAASFPLAAGMLMMGHPTTLGAASGFFTMEIITSFTPEQPPVHHNYVGLAGLTAILTGKSYIPKNLRQGLSGLFHGIIWHHMVTEDILNPKGLSLIGPLWTGLTLLLLGENI
jgi:glycosyltransferase involved in cell wall biosynthesis